MHVPLPRTLGDAEERNRPRRFKDSESWGGWIFKEERKMVSREERMDPSEPDRGISRWHEIPGGGERQTGAEREPALTRKIARVAWRGVCSLGSWQVFWVIASSYS